MNEGKLAAALAAVQKELPPVTKNCQAIVPTKDGGRYGYKYADLPAVTEAIVPLLGRHGLAFMCKPTVIDGHLVLAYSLLHESGEREDGIYPLPQGVSPQQLGSAITYGRRYCLAAVTGVAADEDDDGAAASAEPAREDKPKPARRTSAEWAAYRAAQDKAAGGPEKPAEPAELPALPDPQVQAQQLAEKAQSLAQGGTIPALRSQVYEVAEKAGLLTTRVLCAWNGTAVPLSWVVSEARRRIESGAAP